LAGLKHLNCLDYVLALGELPADGERQGLLLDESGHMIEVTSANLFLVQGGRLRTPLLHRCGVAGTMRRWIIETLAAKLKLEVDEQDLPLQVLKGADEVFICNSVFGVMPVYRLAECRWRRGAVTSAVQEQVMKLFYA
jgi:4-amino-4-deoxychorismate lyase